MSKFSNKAYIKIMELLEEERTFHEGHEDIIGEINSVISEVSAVGTY